LVNKVQWRSALACAVAVTESRKVVDIPTDCRPGNGDDANVQV